MKILTWIVAPVFMAIIEECKDGVQDYMFFLLVPACILQITYWYIICNFKVVFGL